MIRVIAVLCAIATCAVAHAQESDSADAPAGAPAPPPAWWLADITEPVTVAQEGVFAVLATYEAYDEGFYAPFEPTFTVTVTDAEGSEVAGEASWAQITGLVWRATSGPLDAGAELSAHLEFVNHPDSWEDNIVTEPLALYDAGRLAPVRRAA